MTVGTAEQWRYGYFARWGSLSTGSESHSFRQSS